MLIKIVVVFKTMDVSRLKELSKHRHLLIIVCIAVIAYVVLRLTQGSYRSENKPEKKWPVHAQTLRSGNHSPSLRIYAKVVAPHHSKISAEFNTTVQRVYVKSGDEVRANQPLLQLNPDQIRLIHQQRKADLHLIASKIRTARSIHQSQVKNYQHELTLVQLARQSLHRFQVLSQKNLVSRANLDQKKDQLANQMLQANRLKQQLDNFSSRLSGLQAEYMSADAAYKKSQLDLQDAQIRAPYAGKVIKVYVGQGEQVQQGSLLLSLFDPHEVELHGQIPHQYLSLLNAALKTGSITGTTVATQPLTKVVLRRLASEVKSGHVSTEGLFTFAAPHPFFAIGTVMAVDVKLPSVANSYVVPITALDQHNTVYLIRQNRLQAVTVKQHGNSSQNGSVVITGQALSTGQKILTSKLSQATNGMLVKAVNS
jgi:multidrug efflux pump subunit AcrA (membrane-fusion protein)